MDFPPAQLGKDFLPIIDQLRVLDGLQEFAPVGWFDEKPAQIGECPAPAAFEKGEDGVLQHGVHLVPPGGGEPAKDGDEVG